MAPDDQRTVTVTVAVLKAFEAAVHTRYEAKNQRLEAERRLDAAKLEHDRASHAESDAMDAMLAAVKALHEVPLNGCAHDGVTPSERRQGPREIR